jgi:hypothetical protein
MVLWIIIERQKFSNCITANDAEMHDTRYKMHEKAFQT